jgi:hypothetical protein
MLESWDLPDEIAFRFTGQDWLKFLHSNTCSSVPPSPRVPLRVAQGKLRPAPLSPSSGGAAVVSEYGRGSQVSALFSRSRFGLLPVLGVMPLEYGRALGHSGWIWRYLVILLLVPALRWTELKTMKEDFIVDSCNKAWVCCATPGQFGDEVWLLFPCRHGGGTERKLAKVVEGRFGWCGGDVDTANRSAISAVHVWLPTQGAGGQLLRISTPAAHQIFNLHWRLPQGFAAAIYFSPASSGLVPDAGDEGRCGSPVHTGGDEGPDRVFHLFPRVLFAKVEDWFIIVVSCKVLHVNCTSLLSNKVGI